MKLLAVDSSKSRPEHKLLDEKGPKDIEASKCSNSASSCFVRPDRSWDPTRDEKCCGKLNGHEPIRAKRYTESAILQNKVVAMSCDALCNARMLNGLQR